MRAHRLHVLVSLAPLVLGAVLLAEQGWLDAKAALAGILIDRAFAAHLEDRRVHRPWRWADTHPIARLAVPRLGVRRTVLEGSSGSSMAFGPGHVDGTAAPNRPGNCVLAGHRDSWFAFLGRLEIGDEVTLRTPDGLERYAVSDISVRSRRDTAVLGPTPGWRLTLITCYPLDGILRSDLRYVVTCRPA
jgi:sortase A